MHGCAPPHFLLAIWEFLSNFPEQQIERGEPTAWPAHFPYLKPPIFLSLWTPKAYQTHYTYSVKHNASFFKIKLSLYMYATYFSYFSGHHQACQYKNLTEGDKTQ